MKFKFRRDGRGIRGLFLVQVTAMTLIFLTACAQVPPEAVELSDTVGRDLEEVHRSHRAIAGRYFDLMENDLNRFIDEIYGPAYVSSFAKDFRLDKKVAGVVATAPKHLLPLMIRFVETTVSVIETKRSELLLPLKQQRREVIGQIDDAYRQIQAAHATVTAHLASILKVPQAQNEMLKKVGLGGMREKIAMKTSAISERIASLVKEGQKVKGKMDELDGVFRKIKQALH